MSVKKSFSIQAMKGISILLLISLLGIISYHFLIKDYLPENHYSKSISHSHYNQKTNKRNPNTHSPNSMLKKNKENDNHKTWNPNHHKESSSTPNKSEIAIKGDFKTTSDHKKGTHSTKETPNRYQYGTDHLYQIYSKYQNKWAHFYVFLPERKEINEKFPIIYLLHGAYDSYKVWRKYAKKLILQLADKHRVIIVTPDGNPFGWYLDSPYITSNQLSSYIIKELIPFLNNTLLKDLTTNKQSIAGLSMGGHGAITLAIKNYPTFQSASSMSGILDITLHPNQWHINKILGDYQKNQSLWHNHSALILSQKYKNRLLQIPMLITVGDKDKAAIQDNQKYLLFLNQYFKNYLSQEYLKKGIEGMDTSILNKTFIYKEYRNVDHTWDFWVQQLPIHIKWHRKYLR